VTRGAVNGAGRLERSGRLVCFVLARVELVCCFGGDDDGVLNNVSN
jgi:hypothetical protein